jgi:adenylate kinase family enzyme
MLDSPDLPLASEFTPLGEASLGPATRLLVVLQPLFTTVGPTAETMAQTTGLQFLSVNLLLRQAIRERTPAGNLARRFLATEQPVPSAIVLSMLYMAVSEPQICHGPGAIIYGVPRNEDEAALLYELMPAGYFLDFDATDGDLTQRAPVRQECSNPGCQYACGWTFNPRLTNCTICGGPLGTVLGHDPGDLDQILGASRAVRERLARLFGPRYRSVMTNNDMTHSDVVAATTAALAPKPAPEAGPDDKTTTDPAADTSPEG